MVDGTKKNILNQTKESVIGLIADYIMDSEDEVIPITSCHSAVAYWVYSAEELQDSDEIVLLGPNIDNDLVYHSIIMRGNDIIGDSERAADSRQIDSKYDGENGIYTTKMSNANVDEVDYKTLYRITIGDFRNQYLINKDQDIELDNTGPGMV